MSLRIDPWLVVRADAVLDEHLRYRGMGNSTRGRALGIAADVEDSVGDLDLALLPVEAALLAVPLPARPTAQEVRAALRAVTGLADGDRNVLRALSGVRADGASSGVMPQAQGGPGAHLRACSADYRRVVDATRARRPSSGADRAPRQERQATRKEADAALRGVLAGFLCLTMAAENGTVPELRVLAASGLR